MSKHTPGPWTVDFRKTVNEWWIGLSPKEGSTTCAIKCAPLDNEQAKANAHLIAAAPDLLETAKDFLRFIDAAAKENKHVKSAGVVDNGPYSRLIQAIAKAEGKNE